MLSKCISLDLQKCKQLFTIFNEKFYNSKNSNESFEKFVDEEIKKLLKNENVDWIIVWIGNEAYSVYEGQEFLRLVKFNQNSIEENFKNNLQPFDKYILLTQEEAKQLLSDLKEEFEDYEDMYQDFKELAEKEINEIMNSEGVNGIIVRHMSDGETYQFDTSWSFVAVFS